MPQRNLVIVTQRVPFIGFCEACNASFMSYKPGAKEATQIVKAQFDSHTCTDVDTLAKSKKQRDDLSQK